MNKFWYIYRKDHHLGPFTIMNLRELYQQGSLLPGEQIWREGDEGWCALNEYRNLEEILKIKDEQFFIEQFGRWSRGEQLLPDPSEPPELPPIPDEQQWQEHSLAEEELTQEGEEVLPEIPDLPELPSEEEMEAVEALESDEEFEQIDDTPIIDELDDDATTSIDQQIEEEIEQLPEVFKQQKRFSIFKRVLIMATVLLFFLSPIIFLLYLDYDPGIKQLPFVFPAREQQAIWQTINAPKVSAQARVVMANNGKQIWLISNFHFPAEVELKFSSIEKKVLSETPIEFTAHATLNRHIGKIKRVKFLKGKKLIAGSYRVTLRGERFGFIASLLKRLYSQSWARHLKVLYEPHLVFYATTTAFISRSNPQEFDLHLKEFFHKKRMAKLAPYKEWIEKFKTLSFTVNQFKKLITDHLVKYRHRRDLEKFERDYSAYIGGLIQNIIVQEQRKREKLPRSSKFYRYQKKFLSYAIATSKIGGSIVARLEKRKRRFTIKWRRAFIKRYHARLNKLRDQIDKTTDELIKALQKI